jgi:hypothetical protein
MGADRDSSMQDLRCDGYAWLGAEREPSILDGLPSTDYPTPTPLLPLVELVCLSELRMEALDG